MRKLMMLIALLAATQAQAEGLYFPVSIGVGGDRGEFVYSLGVGAQFNDRISGEATIGHFWQFKKSTPQELCYTYKGHFQCKQYAIDESKNVDGGLLQLNARIVKGLFISGGALLNNNGAAPVAGVGFAVSGLRVEFRQIFNAESFDSKQNIQMLMFTYEIR